MEPTKFKFSTIDISTIDGTTDAAWLPEYGRVHGRVQSSVHYPLLNLN